MRPNGNKFQRRRSGWSPRPSCWSSGDCDIVGRIRPTRNRQLTPSRIGEPLPSRPTPSSASGILRISRISSCGDLPDLTLLAPAQITIYNKQVVDHTVTANGISGNLADVYIQI